MIRYPILILLLFVSLVGQAQNFANLSSIDFKNLSENQLELILNQAKAAGYTESQLLALAKEQGLSINELEVLNNQLTAIKSKRIAKSSNSPVGDSRLRSAYSDSLDVIRSKKSDIFGLDLFKGNSFLSFQPSLNIPVPNNYRIGPGDELYIDIYGTSENYYQAEVTPDGKIILENIGPISLAGLTLAQTKARLKTKLSSIYTDLNNDNSTTQLNVSLGNLRSIKVSVVGQVELPGTYTLSSLSTAFSALYASGGITEDGTLRAVQLFRNSELISEIDLYEFLLNGNSSKNLTLEDNDVIIVGTYGNRIKLSGAIKNEAYFELKESETIQDLLFYSGGFAPNADPTQVSIGRIINGQREIADVAENQFKIFTLSAGDELNVREVVNNFANRIIVSGAVFNSGQFELVSGNELRNLLVNRAGLRPDALLDQAIIKRTLPDFNTEIITFDLSAVLDGSINIDLQKEDVITILSKNDLFEENYISVQGEINNPGVIPYSQSISISDIILLAGGLQETAIGGRVEVARRKANTDSDQETLANIMVYELSDEKSLKDVILSPFDQVYIRRNPNHQVQSKVRVEGEVLFPGAYVINNQNERISDLLERAGGIKQYAFIEGATLLRKTEFAQPLDETEKQRNDLIKLKARLEKNDILTDEEVLLLERINRDIESLQQESETNTTYSLFTKRERLKEILSRNNLLEEASIKTSESIGINLQEVINSPGSRSDLLIEEGDVLIIPKRDETVRLRGKLLYPATVRFEQSKGLKHYINMAGGYDNRAKKSGTYLVYANGDVARTKKFLFFKFYPKVKPGSDIIVPTKPLKIPVRVQDVVAITSGLATLALLINQISNNNNP